MSEFAAEAEPEEFEEAGVSVELETAAEKVPEPVPTPSPTPPTGECYRLFT